MEFIKEKFFYWGLIAGSLWTAFGVLVLVFLLSEAPLEESLTFLYEKKQLGGLISLAALINLPVFFLSIRKKKYAFAAGIVAISLATVLLIVFLKVYS